ncbi:hypothetical protein ACWGDT_35160 [Streptomyces avermitilis]
MLWSTRSEIREVSNQAQTIRNGQLLIHAHDGHTTVAVGAPTSAETARPYYGDAGTCRRTVFAWLPASTPVAGTPPTATSAPSNTNIDTTPLNSRSPRDQLPRVHLHGVGPLSLVAGRQRCGDVAAVPPL